MDWGFKEPGPELLPDLGTVRLHANSLQSCPILCDPIDCSPPGSSVHGILQANILECIAVSSSRDLPDPGIKLASLMSLALADGFFTTSATWEALWGMLGLLSTIESIIPNAPDLTMWEVQFPDTQPSLTTVTGQEPAWEESESLIAPGSLACRLQPTFQLLESVSEMCWLNSSAACIMPPYLETSIIIKGACLELLIHSCMSTKITQGGNLDTLGPDSSLPDKATLITSTVPETTHQAAFPRCNRFWVGTHMNLQPNHWEEALRQNWKVN